jgi:quercetin dioxygenase-like cupin family protein
MRTPRMIAAALLATAAAPSMGATGERGSEGVVREHAKPAVPGPADNFSGGKVTVRPIVDASEIGHTGIGEVVFQRGARSNWHTHPGGQALYIAQGCGWTQRENGPVVKICKGDTAYVPAGVKHWHGGTATSGMTQLAITEMVDGKNVTWLEPVTDQQFAAGLRDAP